jgi:chromosome partitioning protein
LDQTRRGAEVKVFDVVVKESVRFKESPIRSESILTYASGSEGARAYRKLAEEIDHG